MQYMDAILQVISNWNKDFVTCSKIKVGTSQHWYTASLPLDPRDILLRVQAWPRMVDFYGWQKSLARISFGGEVKPSVPCCRFTACKRTLHSMSEMLCQLNFLTCFSPVIFSCFATRWLWLLNQAESKWCCGNRLATCSSNTLNQAMKPY
jgi:hypothetical protein